jgi:hypothetical protein
MTDYATFEGRKRQLQDHLNRLMELLSQGEVVPDPGPDLHLLQGIRDGLAGDLLIRILCVGDFSTGKSSFINRFLLEQDLLPAWRTPTTTLPTCIRYGERLKAIRYRPSTQEGVDLEAEEVTEDIPGTLKDWVSTAGKGAEAESIFPVIVEAPASRLVAGVEIVDAPGLNDPNLERMRLTLDYLHQADGVLFFINAMAPWSKYQKTFFEGEILSRDLLDRLYIIVNYWDQVEPAQRDEVLEYIEQQVRASLAKGMMNPVANLNIPILPVSAKTGENAELVQQQVWDALSARKFGDVLSLRIDRFNKELDKYGRILDDRLALLGLDAQGRSRRRAQLQQEVKDYEQQREAFLAGLTRLLELEFLAYRQGLQGLFQWIQQEVASLDQPSRGPDPAEFNKLLALRMSRLQQQASRRLQDVNEAFVQQIRCTIERQKATIGVLPTKAVTMEDYVLHWRGPSGNLLNLAAPLAGGVGIAGLLVGAGTLWQTAIVVPTTVVPAVTASAAVPGLLSQIGTFVMGAPAVTAVPAVTTAQAASSFMLFGIPGIAIGVLAVGGALLLKRIATQKAATDVRSWCIECANEVLAEENRLVDQIKQTAQQRIAAICANVDDDITRAWREKLAELDTIQRDEDQGASVRRLGDDIAGLALRVNP